MEWHEHPLVILLAGAVLTGVVFPYLTRRWQNHQKELEIKVGLVSDMSQATMEFVMAIQLAHLGSTTQTGGQFDKEYRTWEVKSAVIGTQLQAYYRNRIPAEWTRFSELVESFYALEGVPRAEKAAHQERLRTRLMEALRNRRRVSPDWGDLKNAILEWKSELIQGVLRSRISLRPSSRLAALRAQRS
jgi:hypothetical protein